MKQIHILVGHTHMAGNVWHYMTIGKWMRTWPVSLTWSVRLHDKQRNAEQKAENKTEKARNSKPKWCQLMHSVNECARL